MNATPSALRIGVVGAAHWARTVHLPGALASGATVVGLWSRTQEKTCAVAEERGITAFESFDELIDAVDIVTMAVPPFVQAELAVRAARAGKHLLLDKPIATSVHAAEEIRDAVAESGTACLVFHTRQFVPEIEEAIGIAVKQAFTVGKVYLHYPVMTDPESPYTRTGWRESDHAAYWELGPHALSSSIPVLGPVTAVRALPLTGAERIAVWSTTHGSGRTCDYSLSTFADAAREPRCTFEFSQPSIPSEVGTPDVYSLPDPPHTRAVTFSRAVERLLDAVATGDRSDPRGADMAVEIVRVLEAATVSASSGETVYLET